MVDANAKYRDPRLADWLGESGGGTYENIGNTTQYMTEEERLRNREIVANRTASRAQNLLAAGLDERGNQLPAYGTPTSQGGTAKGYAVTPIALGKRDAALDANGRATRVAHRVVGLPGEGADGFSAAYTHTFNGGATPEVAGSIGAAGAGAPKTQDVLAAGISPIAQDAASRSDQGSAERANALQGIIDRYENVGLDTTQSDESRKAQQLAIQMNSDLFRKAQGFNRDAAAQKYSENALAASLAVARSSPGAAGREAALFNALSSMPAAQAEGQRQANEEGRAMNAQALNAAQQLGQQATATRSLDESRAETKASIGLDVAKGIANFTGTDLELDQRDREFLGEVALAVARLNLDTSKMSSDEAIALAQQEIQRQGLAQEYRMFKEGRKISDRDILGGIFSLGGAAIAGFASGKAAGA